MAHRGEINPHLPQPIEDEEGEIIQISDEELDAGEVKKPKRKLREVPPLLPRNEQGDDVDLAIQKAKKTDKEAIARVRKQMGLTDEKVSTNSFEDSLRATTAKERKRVDMVQDTVQRALNGELAQSGYTNAEEKALLSYAHELSDQVDKYQKIVNQEKAALKEQGLFKRIAGGLKKTESASVLADLNSRLDNFNSILRKLHVYSGHTSEAMRGNIADRRTGMYGRGLESVGKASMSGSTSLESGRSELSFSQNYGEEKALDRKISKFETDERAKAQFIEDIIAGKHNGDFTNNERNLIDSYLTDLAKMSEEAGSKRLAKDYDKQWKKLRSALENLYYFSGKTSEQFRGGMAARTTRFSERGIESVGQGSMVGGLPEFGTSSNAVGDRRTKPEPVVKLTPEARSNKDKFLNNFKRLDLPSFSERVVNSPITKEMYSWLQEEWEQLSNRREEAEKIVGGFGKKFARLFTRQNPEVSLAKSDIAEFENFDKRFRMVSPKAELPNMVERRSNLDERTKLATNRE